ncbi:hypothetical protein DFJ43DRAFT_1107040 [Lentinula guzmanii]|uniref:Uncharacterized protein n=1 Tax=Lentinula guzmanii TaxID=2804957 RepID=A0AA38JD19_9AGAR|nr:hypothetical protein DFJ43DRAFT_1107040 [Lentinula guzmanii]
MHLRLGVWMTALVLGLMHPILGIPTGQRMRIEQDPSSPGKILNAGRYIKQAFVLFQSTEPSHSAHQTLNLADPDVRAAKMMVEFLLESAWKELDIEPLIRWSVREAYAVKLPEIVIRDYAPLAPGWTPAKELNFLLDRIRTKKSAQFPRVDNPGTAYVKPIPGEEGTYEICVEGLVKQTVNIGSETLKELRKLVPFEWAKK